MQYTIKPENKFQTAIKNLTSKVEDIFLSMVMILAKITKSEKLSAWLQGYTEKKMQQLQQEIIRMKWDKITLDKATAAIQNQEIISKNT